MPVPTPWPACVRHGSGNSDRSSNDRVLSRDRQQCARGRTTREAGHSRTTPPLTTSEMATARHANLKKASGGEAQHHTSLPQVMILARVDHPLQEGPKLVNAAKAVLAHAERRSQLECNAPLMPCGLQRLRITGRRTGRDRIGRSAGPPPRAIARRRRTSPLRVRAPRAWSRDPSSTLPTSKCTSASQGKKQLRQMSASGARTCSMPSDTSAMAAAGSGPKLIAQPWITCASPP